MPAPRRPRPPRSAPLVPPEAPASRARAPLRRIAGSSGAMVSRGRPEVAGRFPKCCRPIPGDQLEGLVTRARGITMHRTDCVNVMHMSEADTTRLIAAEWQETARRAEENYTA